MKFSLSVEWIKYLEELYIDPKDIPEPLICDESNCALWNDKTQKCSFRS